MILLSRILIGFFLSSALCLHGQGANKFRFTGRVTDAVAVWDGRLDFRFRVFDMETGGAQVGVDIVHTNVLIASGNFSVILDLSTGPYVGGQAYWVQAEGRFHSSTPIEFGPLWTFNPRKRVQIGSTRGLKVYRTPGIYEFVVPAGVHEVLVEAWGGGGGGGGGNIYEGNLGPVGWGGGGGGGAGYVKAFVPVMPGATNSIIVGGGGSAGTGYPGTNNPATAGRSGTNTVFFDHLGDMLLFAGGGGGGGGAGGVNSNGFGGVSGTNWLKNSVSDSAVMQDGAAGRTVEGSINGYYPYPAIGGPSALGSLQTGRIELYAAAGTWAESDVYGGMGPGFGQVPTWSERIVTFGQGGFGQGALADWYPPPNPSFDMNLPTGGTNGCVILKW